MSGRFCQSLTRDILVSGGEREPAGVVIGTGLCFLALGWQSVSPVSIAVGITVLSGGLYAIRRIAKADPKMFGVYRRYIFYRSYYPARSTPAAGCPASPAAISLPAAPLIWGVGRVFLGPAGALVMAVLAAAVLHFLISAGNKSR